MHVYDLRNEDGKKLSGLVKERPSLVRFHWDQCGHCIQMKPEWEKVKSELGKSDIFNVIDVEMSAVPHVATELKKNVDGYPTIKAFHNKGKDQFLYEGPRTSEEIVSWFKSMKGGKARRRTKTKSGSKKGKNSKKLRRSKTIRKSRKTNITMRKHRR
jgi:thiol-disulfide isomerase/thioredoxin